MKETGKLIKKYFSPTTIVPKQISGDTLNGREMLELFKAFQGNADSFEDLALRGYSVSFYMTSSVLGTYAKLHTKYLLAKVKNESHRNKCVPKKTQFRILICWPKVSA